MYLFENIIRLKANMSINIKCNFIENYNKNETMT